MTLQTKSKPLTAQQYIDQSIHARNVAANKRADVRAFCFRTVCYLIAITLGSVAMAGLIQLVVLFTFAQ